MFCSMFIVVPQCQTHRFYVESGVETRQIRNVYAQYSTVVESEFGKGAENWKIVHCMMLMLMLYWNEYQTVNERKNKN